jgi:hypothetical protein
MRLTLRAIRIVIKGRYVGPGRPTAQENTAGR